MLKKKKISKTAFVTYSYNIAVESATIRDVIFIL